ncbi:MAG: uroporphyrinogen decarboxylase [Elusimicrobia bacterium]|nr:uroporphyrinogen decarboxylase [Elusimicrobiota bacterium]
MQALRRQTTSRTPVWFMRQAGRSMQEYRSLREKYTLLEICKKTELACEVTLQPVRKLGVDAAILFADILLPAAPLGISFDFSQGEGPVIRNPIREAGDVERLRSFDPREDLSFVLSTIRLVRKELSSSIALIGFAGAPFTLASYLIEGGRSDYYLRTKSMMHQRPDLWEKLMDKITTATFDYLSAQAEAGAQAVQLFDSWAGALSPEDYQKFVLPYSQKILERLAQAGIPTIHFSTGTGGFLDLLRKAGGDALSVDWRISLKEAWKKIGYDKGIQGNLDPASLLSPPEILKSLTQNILHQAEGRPGHIFNLGHGVLPQTPEDHLKIVVETVKEWKNASSS